MGAEFLCHLVLVAAAVVWRQLDHRSCLFAVVGGFGDTSDFRMDSRASLPVGEIPGVSAARYRDDMTMDLVSQVSTNQIIALTRTPFAQENRFSGYFV